MRCVMNAHSFYLMMSNFLISSRPSGGGIVRQLPQEARRFAAIDKIYEKVCSGWTFVALFTANAYSITE